VVKEGVIEIEVQAATWNYVFFVELEERLMGVNWSCADFNSLIALVFVKSGGVFE
jgi:hypothetical protein